MLLKDGVRSKFGPFFKRHRPLFIGSRREAKIWWILCVFASAARVFWQVQMYTHKLMNADGIKCHVYTHTRLGSWLSMFSCNEFNVHTNTKIVRTIPVLQH